MIDNKTVQRYWKKHSLLMKFGFKFGLIRGYSDFFIKRLREVYYGGVPASIILLNPYSCCGKCYDRAVLACLALEDMDYKVVHANIDSIRYNRKTVEEVNYWLSKGEKISAKYPNHCFVEVVINGRTWVIDTTDALVYDKRLYYLINNPQINCIKSKEETMNFPDYIDIKEADIERDKYASLFVLPIIEEQIEKGSYYKERAREEIRIFKDRIQFEQLSAEYEAEKEEFFARAEERRRNRL